MEKKGSRLVQPLQKGLGTDSKKSQDANKLWPRGCRRREPNVPTFPKNETSRKPTPQRNKTIDKRPRPRGFCSGAVGGAEESGLVEQGPELGSVFLQGSKKQSLNHLLNFHFESRENKNVGHRWNSTLKHKYNKEQFLQANCQFIVSERGDYKAYTNNPDALVNWDLIEQVNIHVLEFPSCPICLYQPVAAKMTRCGHIYCWSCMLHYLALSDKAWRKCPICYESVHKNDLKSVVTIPHATLNTNNYITFKLMKRARGSLIAYPADFQASDQDVLYNVSDKIATDVYSKLLTASRDEVNAIIEREQSELLRQLAEDENCPEKCFIEQALDLLHERNQAATAANVSEVVHELPCVNDNSRQRFESVSSDEVNGNVDDLEVCEGNRPAALKYFYFYQASDGQHIYMHNLNVRMLEHTYGSLEFCPKTVTGCILEKESGSITEELRKRQRYMQHLPVTCQFELAEIQLKPPIVNVATLHHFYEQIEARHKHRKRRHREEKRREKRITEEENKMMGKYATADIQIESQQHFPDFQAALAMEEAAGQSSPRSQRSMSPASQPSPPASLNDSESSTGLSFAKMLSSKKKSTPVWPVKMSVIASSATVVESNDCDVEAYGPVPTYNPSFGDVIALALEKASLSNDNGNLRSGKKKKKQKKILFSTAMVVNGNERI